MKISEILSEKKVVSTWITDLIHNRPNKILTMRLSNGKYFTIAGITRRMFEKWNMSPSKGRFWHQFIKGKHKVTRIK